MVTIAPYPPVSSENAVDRTRHADGKSARAARKRDFVGCFDEQMDVVGLNREVHDAKTTGAITSEGTPQLEKNSLASQTGQPTSGSQCHVHRMTRLVVGPRQVRHAGARSLGLASRSGAPPAPGPKGELALR
jgi:hypothetical protein